MSAGVRDVRRGQEPGEFELQFAGSVLIATAHGADDDARSRAREAVIAALGTIGGTVIQR